MLVCPNENERPPVEELLYPIASESTPVAVLEFDVILPLYLIFPLTSNFSEGLSVPIPTLPPLK